MKLLMGWVLIWLIKTTQHSDQIRSVTQSCPTLCDPMNRSTPGLPVHHQLPEFTQTQVHRVSDAIQPSHPAPFSSCPQSLPASESFPMSQLFAWAGQSIWVSALASFLPKKISKDIAEMFKTFYLLKHCCLWLNCHWKWLNGKFEPLPIIWPMPISLIYRFLQTSWFKKINK